MFICNVFLTFVVKRLIKGIHKMFLKHSIINGFRTHHFLNFAKVFKTQKCLLGKYQKYKSVKLWGLRLLFRLLNKYLKYQT